MSNYMHRAFSPSYRGWLALCRAIGETVEPHQKLIARALLDGDEREVAVCVSRGNDKTTTAALLAVHHLLTVPGADVALGAASRAQARIAFERMKGFAEHPALADQLVVRHLELRAERGGLLRVLPADGPRSHGLSSSLYIGDEVWCWRDGGLLEAMQTGLAKRPDAKLLLISTSAAHHDSPLGRLRSRALAGRHERQGAVIDASHAGIRWLEWSAPEDADLDDYALAARVNPAARFTPAVLAEARARVAEQAYRQFHLNQFGVSEAQWLPAGAWAACQGPVDLTPRTVWLGVDIGGARAASAVVGVTEDLQVPICEVYTGDEAVLAVSDAIVRLAGEGWIIEECAFDPWRFEGEALRLARDHGVRMVQFAQSHGRMVPASEALHAAIVEHKLRHPGHPELDAHVAGAVARATGRGWRLDKSERGALIDAVVAMAMAVERAQFKPEPVRLIGWA
jgi:phage terminase large subunit-like protein